MRPSSTSAAFSGSSRRNLIAERRGDTTEEPNGLSVSPDEAGSTSPTTQPTWCGFSMSLPDARSPKPRPFANHGRGPRRHGGRRRRQPVRHDSNGIEVFAPDGSLCGAIPVSADPGQPAPSVGADGRTLYITARAGIYRVTLAPRASTSARTKSAKRGDVKPEIAATWCTCMQTPMLNWKRPKRHVPFWACQYLND